MYKISNAAEGIARKRNIGFGRHGRELWQVVRGLMQSGLHVEPIYVSGIASNHSSEELIIEEFT